MYSRDPLLRTLETNSSCSLLQKHQQASLGDCERPEVHACAHHCTDVRGLCGWSTASVSAASQGRPERRHRVMVPEPHPCPSGRYKKGDVSVLNEFMPGGGTTPGRTPGGSTPTPAAAGTRACLAVQS